MTDLCVHSSWWFANGIFRLYDNILYRNQLAHGVRLLAADRRRDDAHFDETPCGSSAMAGCWLSTFCRCSASWPLSFGELHLGKRRAERAKAMWPSTARWLKELKESRRIFATEYSEVAEPLFQLCNRRRGIDGVKGNQLQLLTTTDDTLKALIRDIELARHNIEMVFYIWQPGGTVDQVAESLMAAARRGVHCRLMLDSAGSLQFSAAPTRR